MSQSDQQLFLQSRFLIYALVIASGGVAAALLSGHFIAALLSGGIISALAILMIRHAESGTLAPKIQYLVLASLPLPVLLGLYAGLDEMMPWSLLPPLIFSFLLSAKKALVSTVLYAMLVLISLDHSGLIFDAAQYSPILLLCLGIVGGFSYLREIRQRQLQPLRRTDNLTMAASQEHLEEDLAKEIQRSEREGSELAVIALAIDQEHIAKLEAKELDNAAIEIGRLLHNNLRLFDSYYLWKTHQFLIVLPHTSSAQGVKIANTIRVKIRKELTVKGETLSVSMGVSGLNVGDDPKSMTRRAESALSTTQTKASNRTHLYRESELDASTEDDQTGEPA